MIPKSGLRPLLSDDQGEMVVAPEGWAAVARSGREFRPISRWIPLPPQATLMHLPGRLGMAANSKTGKVAAVPGRHQLAVAAVLPVGYLRLLLPAYRSDERVGQRTLPLYGYTAAADLNGEIVVAATKTDDFAPWTRDRPGRAALEREVETLQRQMPRSRVVAQISVCALAHNCLTAQNTFLGRGEAALPTSAACNADCLGCISLQTDSGAPAAQPRIGRAPTADDLIAVGRQHLRRSAQVGEAGMVSFGQGCEGEPLLRERQLLTVAEVLRREFPAATIHINTNGSRPSALQRLFGAGVNSCRISIFSFDQLLFAAYYRPRGYRIDQVMESCRVAAGAGAQLTVNLLTFPGISDSPKEVDLSIARLGELGVSQLQLRTLNVDPLWLLGRVPGLDSGIGIDCLVARLRASLPLLQLGNFTRPTTRSGFLAPSGGA